MFFRILFVLGICLFAKVGVAQMLSMEPVVSQQMPQKNEEVMPVKANNLEKNTVTSEKTEALSLEDLMNANRTNSEPVLEPVKKDVTKKADEDVFIPEGALHRLNTPTADGSVRGGQALVEIDEQGRMKKVESIFLFYDNFKITQYIKDSGSCDVRFNILSNLDRKISQIDLKLVWPGLTTTLSFSNVAPNTQTYYNYSLIGDGCYKMDMAPNIIVNRCRVKGMTASECAGKIIWLSK